MSRYSMQGTFTDGQGAVVGSGTVSVYLAGTSTAASIYTAASGGTAVNSVTTDTGGKYEFYVDDGDYNLDQDFKITLSKTGFTAKSYDNVKLFPFANGIVQIASTQSGALIDKNTATTMPYDDTIPQKTEGEEIYTKAITPISATNKLVIDAVVNFSSAGAADIFILALFQDDTADAIAAVPQCVGIADKPRQAILTYEMTAGTTDATTFKLRGGVQSASGFVVNGDVTSPERRLGGVCISSLKITEVKV